MPPYILIVFLPTVVCDDPVARLVHHACANRVGRRRPQKRRRKIGDTTTAACGASTTAWLVEVVVAVQTEMPSGEQRYYYKNKDININIDIDGTAIAPLVLRYAVCCLGTLCGMTSAG